MAPRGWRDRKRYLWLGALGISTLTFIAVGLHAMTGWGAWLWLGPIVILGIIPLVDAMVGLDPSNPPDDAIAELESDRYYRWLTFLFLPLQYAGFALALWYIATGPLTTWNRVALAVTVGFIGGLGINAAHEMGHKREERERWLSRVALAQTGYGHFYVEHNRGHHVRVATPDDPASSRLGESFYAFWPRTVVGSFRSAWAIEARRLKRRGQHAWRPGNDVINSLAFTAVLWAVMLVWLGPVVLPYLVLQAVVGFTLLEAVNYLEHYGLLRQWGGAAGHERFERVKPWHSWNSNNLVTNLLLFHLQRHSDHHAHPTRRYQALRDEEAPALPTGYGGMILLALVPPLWFRVMDPRVLAYYDGDASRANLTPRRRRALRASAARALEGQVPPGDVVGDVMRCPGCGYTYDVELGDEREGFPAGTAWTAVPDSWCCPDCGVRDKVDFVAVERADR